MLLKGLNTLGGSEISFSTLSLNLQAEILFMEGSAVGIITHYDRTVYRPVACNKHSEAIQTMLWDRTKNVYRFAQFTMQQETQLHTRFGWILQALYSQMNIVLGNASDRSEPAEVVIRGGNVYFPKSFRHSPIIVKLYDTLGDPVNDDPDARERSQDETDDRYYMDDEGIVYENYWS